MTGRVPTKDDPIDLISISQLMKVLEHEPEPEPTYDDGVPDMAPPPKVKRMPEGIEVTERRLGRAVGRWVLQVRCECGRRWFEVDPVQTADCPRCGAMVLVEIDPT
jgi:hypothetical protein